MIACAKSVNGEAPSQNYKEESIGANSSLVAHLGNSYHRQPQEQQRRTGNASLAQLGSLASKIIPGSASHARSVAQGFVRVERCAQRQVIVHVNRAVSVHLLMLRWLPADNGPSVRWVLVNHLLVATLQIACAFLARTVFTQIRPTAVSHAWNGTCATLAAE